MICVDCGRKITTWYQQSFRGPRAEEKIFTCSHCLNTKAIARFQETGYVEGFLTTDRGELEGHTDVKAAIETLRVLAASELLNLQSKIGLEMATKLAENNGEYRASEYPSNFSFVNCGGIAEVHFSWRDSNDFHWITFEARECDPQYPWKLLDFAGSKEGLRNLFAVNAFLLPRAEFRWVIPD